MLGPRISSLVIVVMMVTGALADDHFREFPDADVVTPMELFRALAQMQDLPPELIDQARRLARENGIELNRDPNGEATIPRVQNDPNRKNPSGGVRPDDPNRNAPNRKGANRNDNPGANGGANPRTPSGRNNPGQYQTDPRQGAGPRPRNGMQNNGSQNNGTQNNGTQNNGAGNNQPGSNSKNRKGVGGPGNGGPGGGSPNQNGNGAGNGTSGPNGSPGPNNLNQGGGSNSPNPAPANPPRRGGFPPRQPQRSRAGADENFRQRMNRILMDAARDAANSEPQEQGQRSGFEKLLAAAQERVEKSLEKNGPSVRRRMRSRWSKLKNNVREPNSSTQWLSNSPSAPALPSTSSRAWVWVIALLVVGVAGLMFVRRLPRHVERQTALQRARHAKQVQWMIRTIKTRKDFVTAFDEFVIWSGGSQSRSWNSQIVQASLLNAHPEYSKQIGELVDQYNISRYAPDPLHSAESERLTQNASTLHHLATAGAGQSAGSQPPSSIGGS